MYSMVEFQTSLHSATVGGSSPFVITIEINAKIKMIFLKSFIDIYNL